MRSKFAPHLSLSTCQLELPEDQRLAQKWPERFHQPMRKLDSRVNGHQPPIDQHHSRSIRVHESASRPLGSAQELDQSGSLLGRAKV